MAEERDQSSLSQKLAAELAGTFFATLVPTAVDVLFYTGGHVDFVSRWLARGFVTVAMIYAFSEISGAHIDPAVSLGFAARRVFGVRLMLEYWAAQFAGAFAAAGLAFALWGNQIALGASHPGPEYSQTVAFVAEVVATFLLMTVILASTEHEATVGKNAAIAVGLTVATCGFFLGPISGASMNPARTLAPQILGGTANLAWIYALGPSLGALLAVVAAYLISGPPKRGEDQKAGGK
ncbi:MAG: aquaporin [Candidatus Eremiobacteraeota bacterium]|nr:aquaporin [Candidatus Eremiobacteraeota bacterium]